MSARPGTAADGRSRPRLATDRKIEAAVREIITTEGPQAVTVEKVSEVSGVARTTLYRRYRNKYELLHGVAEQITPTIPPEPEVSLAGFTRVLERLQEAFATPGIGQLVAHMLGADEEFLATWRERFIGPRTAVISDFLDRGVREGVLVADTADELTTELILGALLAGTAMHGRLPEHWAAAVAERLWPLIAA
jgi:AcrR family transcriptional regulator